MSYLCEELSNLLSFQISEGPRRKSDTVSRFSKCRNEDERGDYSCFAPEDLDSLMNRLRRSFENASAGLKGSSVCAAVDRIFISLKRPNVFLHGLREALSLGSHYGRNKLMEGKNVSVIIDAAAGPSESPSRWRLERTREILQKAVSFSGGVLTPDNPASFILTLSNKNRRPVENGAVIFVGNVCSRSESLASMADFRRAFSEQISQMSQVRLGEDDGTPDSNLDNLTLASLSFALLSGNLSKTVNIQLDSSITPFCKGAVFVLYNYCRMNHLIFKYTKLEKSGSYPPLPDIDLVDFSLLTSPEEWNLMFNFVVDWPNVLYSTVSELATGEFKLHRIFDFLKSLASKFSAYYRRTRILTDSRPHLMPVLQARIYLLLGLMEVYRNALDLLNLQTVQNM